MQGGTSVYESRQEARSQDVVRVTFQRTLLYVRDYPPARRSTDFVEEEARVTRCGTFTVRAILYSAPLA